METEDIRVTQPVEIQNYAKARVALELMDRISRVEQGVAPEQKTREYWLTLYRQCWKAANGDYLKGTLERS